MINWFRRQSQRMFSFLLVTAAILGLGLAAYQFLHTKQAFFDVDIIADSNVVDVNQPLPELSLLFEGQDILESGLNLRLLTIRYANTGDANLLQTQYDQQIAWGIHVDALRVVQARVVQATSGYLKSNVKPTITDDNTVSLNKVIMEPGEIFDIELLVLHRRDQSPTISVLGKIAGMDSIPIRHSASVSKSPGFIAQLLNGSLLVHVSRMGLYFVGFLLFISLPIVIIVAISEKVSDFGRNKRRKKYDITIPLSSTGKQEWVELIREGYIKDGLEWFADVRRALGSADALRSILRSSTPSIHYDADSAKFKRIMVSTYTISQTYQMELIGSLKKAGALTEDTEPGQFVLDDDFRTFFESVADKLARAEGREAYLDQEIQNK